jgi:hypothetical protein
MEWRTFDAPQHQLCKARRVCQLKIILSGSAIRVKLGSTTLAAGSAVG